jgi:hypothetical protein
MPPRELLEMRDGSASKSLMTFCQLSAPKRGPTHA